MDNLAIILSRTLFHYSLTYLSEIQIKFNLLALKILQKILERLISNVGNIGIAPCTYVKVFILCEKSCKEVNEASSKTYSVHLQPYKECINRVKLIFFIINFKSINLFFFENLFKDPLKDPFAMNSSVTSNIVEYIGQNSGNDSIDVINFLFVFAKKY